MPSVNCLSRNTPAGRRLSLGRTRSAAIVTTILLERLPTVYRVRTERELPQRNSGHAGLAQHLARFRVVKGNARTEKVREQ